MTKKFIFNTIIIIEILTKVFTQKFEKKSLSLEKKEKRVFEHERKNKLSEKKFYLINVLENLRSRINATRHM